MKKSKTENVSVENIPVMVNFEERYVELLDEHAETLNLPKGRARATVVRMLVVGKLKELYPERAAGASS